MTKYNQIMEKISVTPQMKERILEQVALHDTQEPEGNADRKSKLLRFVRWGSGAVAACLVLLAGIRAYQVYHPPGETDHSVLEGQYSVEEYASLEELEQAIGFSVPDISDIPFQVKDRAYTNSFGIARVDYQGASDEMLTISKAVDDGSDISGDYTEYEAVSELELEGCKVAMKGNDGTISLAVWTEDGYAYAVSASPGLAESEMKDVLREIIAEE